MSASSPNDSSVVDQNDANERPPPPPSGGVLGVLDRVAEAVALALFTIMMLVVLLQVAARFTSIAIIWTEELARILLVVSAVIAMAVCVRRREHIIVDYFIDRMSPPVRRWLAVVLDVSVLGFLVLWLRGSIRLAELNAGTIFVTVPWIAVSHLYWAEIASIVLMMIFVAADLAQRLRRSAPAP